jgi:hypothetical protein
MDKAARYRDFAAQCMLMASEETSEGHGPFSYKSPNDGSTSPNGWRDANACRRLATPAHNKGRGRLSWRPSS